MSTEALGVGAFSQRVSPRTRSRLHRQLAFIVMLVLLFATTWSLFSTIRYAQTRRALPQILPGASFIAQGMPPRYAGSIFDVNGPNAVAVSPDGERIYVTEGDGERVTKAFDISGRLLGTLVPPNTTRAIRKPFYVAVGDDERVYVSDRMRPGVLMYDRNGAFLGVYQPEEAEGGWVPLGIQAQRNGLLAVTDIRSNAHRVLVFASNEEVQQRLLAGPANSRLDFPTAAVRDDSGRTYVSDSNNARIVIYDAGGTAIGELPAADPRGGVALPRGMGIDDLGRLYAVDAASHDVKVFQTGDQLQFLFSFGIGGVDDGQFRYPNGITVDRRGRVWVADWGNNRVQMWHY
ncbi:MAG: hypothetical protein HY675_27785 [Chloroflexi bacterium]|nr:hypothetical protein [Chloroflexota bacterium]